MVISCESQANSGATTTIGITGVEQDGFTDFFGTGFINGSLYGFYSLGCGRRDGRSQLRFGQYVPAKPFDWHGLVSWAVQRRGPAHLRGHCRARTYLTQHDWPRRLGIGVDSMVQVDDAANCPHRN